MTAPLIIHADLLARRLAGRWRGVLLEGPSGAGKSDLALRALALGWRLVADDRVVVWRSEGALWGRAPDALAGRLEVRGIGVVREAAVRLSRIDLVLVHAEAPERLPEPALRDLAGVAVPLLAMNLREPAAPAKLAPALAWASRASE